MNEFRVLIITFPDEKDQNFSILRDLINDLKVQNGIKDRNLQIEYVRKNKFKIELIGYDGNVKYTTDKVNEDFFNKIFNLIDGMPIGQIEKEGRDSESIEEGKITKEDYLRAKRKYLELKKKLIKKY